MPGGCTTNKLYSVEQRLWWQGQQNENSLKAHLQQEKKEAARQNYCRCFKSPYRIQKINQHTSTIMNERAGMLVCLT